MAKAKRRFIDTGAEGFHLSKVGTPGQYGVLIHTVDRKGRFSNGVTIPAEALDQVINHLIELKHEINGVAPSQ